MMGSSSFGLAGFLGLRWLRRRRAAWLAVAAVTLTVAVPVLVLGVVNGFLDVTTKQVRANESDVTMTSPWFGQGVADTPKAHAAVAQLPGVRSAAPFINSWGVLVPKVGRGDSQKGLPVQIDGIMWDADSAIGRLSPAALHKPPVTDLSAPDLPPTERGTGFLSPAWRAELALNGFEIAAACGFGAMPLPPRTRPVPGVICGREVLYGYGLEVGQAITLVGPGGTRAAAVVSDTIGTGVLEVDRFLCLTPLPLAQRLAEFTAKGDQPARIDGWRIQTAPGADLKAVKRALADATGNRVETWMDRRGNMVRSLELQRNIMTLVMISIQVIAVFIVYAVFSTMVAEKRHDIGVLLGLGARRRAIAGAFLAAGFAACLIGGVLGWALGWAGLAALNPLSKALNTPLFPQDVIYTPDAPTSFDPLFPLLFIAIMSGIGLLAVALPAWRAARIEPVDILREGA